MLAKTNQWWRGFYAEWNHFSMRQRVKEWNRVTISKIVIINATSNKSKEMSKP
jgi:hypothetical protein